MTETDDVLEKAKQLRAAGVPLEEIERYVASRRAASAPTGHLGVPFVDAKPEEPSGLTKMLGAVSSVGRGSPLGVLQAVMRAGYGRQPYRQAYEDISGAQEAAPTAARVPFQVAGGLVQAVAMPGSSLLRQGAKFGALTGASNADPDQGAASRGVDAVTGGIMGAVGGGTLGALGKVAGTIKNAPPGGLKKIAESALPDMVRRPLRIARSFRDVTKTAAPKERALSISPAPKAEGLLGNDMDSVVEVLKAQRPPVVSGSPRKQAHRTAAQFKHFAQRTGKAPPEPPPTMEALLAKARKEQPHEPGNLHGDAEIAMGLDAPEPDLADLLRRSLLLGRRP